jgi:hypothetical protein
MTAMTILLLTLLLLAVLDLVWLVRVLRRDSDGRAPRPPYQPFGDDLVRPAV